MRALKTTEGCYVVRVSNDVRLVTNLSELNRLPTDSKVLCKISPNANHFTLEPYCDEEL